MQNPLDLGMDLGQLLLESGYEGIQFAFVFEVLYQVSAT